MRVGIRTTTYVNAIEDTFARVWRVTCPLYRDFWFGVTYDTGSPTTPYVIKAYQREADIGTEALVLAHATVGPCSEAETALTLTGGAPLNVVSMTVTLSLAGSWTGTVSLGWTQNISGELVTQMQRVLERYMGSTDSLGLAGLKKVHQGWTRPPVLPALALLTESEEYDPNSEEYTVNLDLYAYEERWDREGVQRAMADIAGALRTIALDEQRTWGWGDMDQGGPVVNTLPRGSLTIGVSESLGGGFEFAAHLPLRVVLVGVEETRGPAGSGYAINAGQPGYGGKYGDPTA